ncbi:hypothetical protein JSE7799_03814 [Jannaschia seosinensis]|uniref:Bacterial pre-peptidase C-terminal domain protein n=1 Tax=Jannaschia seosinensis TaxID=313367 RepID=A0A0M7BFA8_9RHOB|nr:hypothetical protein [Jannaschia seosinensis]CUH41071.1 hypothetical protein JSE7799_03814 [Jannaschia seosinensis]
MKFLLTAAALALATPASAQAPICGGISLVGEWVGGDEAGSDVSVAGSPFEMEGQVPIAGHLVRLFSISQTTDLRVDVAALRSGDPYISVFDAAGSEIATDDDGGNGLASRLEVTLDPGAYCLAARSYESGVTDVSVFIGRTEQAPEDIAEVNDGVPSQGGAPDAACFIGNMAMLDPLDGVGAVATAAESPAYGFNLDEAMPLSITATSIGGDPLIRVLDSAGAIIAENDDHDGLNSRIDLSDPLAAGEYCVAVEDLDGGDNTINVTVEQFDPTAFRLRRIGQAEFSPTASDDVEVTELGTLDTSVLHDVSTSIVASWVRFDLPEGGLVVTEAIGDGVDPMIVLFDRVGRRIGENDDGPTGLDSFLASRLLAGSYVLAVRTIEEGSTTGNVRLLLQRYVPAE